MVCDDCNRTADWDVFSSTAEASVLDRYEVTIKGHIMNALITACFHIRSDDWELRPDEKPADYLVDVDYNEELYDDWIKPDGQKVLKSVKLTITLYYNGTSGRELVQQWIAEKPQYTRAHYDDARALTYDVIKRYNP